MIACLTQLHPVAQVAFCIFVPCAIAYALAQLFKS